MYCAFYGSELLPVPNPLCWNFETNYGCQEPSTNRVVVPALYDA
jgi:hypothetical protein